jgi:hypothetical protein
LFLDAIHHRNHRCVVRELQNGINVPYADFAPSVHRQFSRD